MNGREVKEILETLDQQFREELIEWLFKCSNEIEIIHDLEKIIKRKRALASDNINSIRAFSYISVLLNKNKFDIGNESNNENKLKEPEKIDFRDIKYIIYYEKPLLTFERLLETYLDSAPRGLRSFIASMQIWLKDKLYMK